MNSYLSYTLLSAVIFPLLVAFSLAVRPLQSLAMRLAPYAALPALLIALTAKPISVHLPFVLLGIELRFEPGSCHLFLLFTALLWWLSGMFARSYFAGSKGAIRFTCYFLLAMCGNLGLVVAYDSMSFYLFFALMSFSSYGLVVHDRTSQALYAGRVYIILVVLGEVALFSALLLAAVSSGSTDFETIRSQIQQTESLNTIIFLAFIGLGIKAGVLGLHVWLPLAHPVAPTPASAVLSGAMIKAGLIGWLRLMPLGEISLHQWGEVFLLLGIAAAFFGVVVGLTQVAPKALLAYSSISQMGLMTIGLGICLLAPESHAQIITVITLFALHHGLNKGALFLGVGVILSCRGRLRKRIWLTLWIPALALAGAPLTSGMAAKFLLKQQTVAISGQWEVLLQSLLPLSSVATTLLVGRFLLLLHKEDNQSSPTDEKAGLIWPWGLLVITSMAVPWIFTPAPVDILYPAAIVGSLWPVLLGALISIAALVLSSRAIKRSETPYNNNQANGKQLLIHIPPGDILQPLQLFISSSLFFLKQLFSVHLCQWRDSSILSIKQMGANLPFSGMLKKIESTLGNWQVSMMIFVLLGMLLGILTGSSW